MRASPLLRAAVNLLILPLFTAICAHAQDGPIPLRDSRPYNLLFLQFRPETADILSPGATSSTIQLDLINNLLIPSPVGAAVIEDNEYQRLLFTWQRGFPHQLEFTLRSRYFGEMAGSLMGL